MSKIYGNVRASDDFTHAVGSESNFNESMYANFFDRTTRVGGFLRVGNRPNEGYAEVTATVYLPDGCVLFSFDRTQIVNNAGFDAGGMRFEIEVPGRALTTTFNGRVLVLDEPRILADPKRAFASSERGRLSIELRHTAVGPMYGTRADDVEVSRRADEQFAKAHYEQHMAVLGHVEFRGQKFGVNGFGLRDHSWGPRYWQAIEGYEWLTMNFGRDCGAVVSIVRRRGAEPKIGGAWVEGDHADFISEASIDLDHEPGTEYHRAVRVAAKTRSGHELNIEGRVMNFLPLRNRREGKTTYIGEGLTEWRSGDELGYGMSEVLRQRA